MCTAACVCVSACCRDPPPAAGFVHPPRQPKFGKALGAAYVYTYVRTWEFWKVHKLCLLEEFRLLIVSLISLNKGEKKTAVWMYIIRGQVQSKFVLGSERAYLRQFYGQEKYDVQKGKTSTCIWNIKHTSGQLSTIIFAYVRAYLCSLWSGKI